MQELICTDIDTGTQLTEDDNSTSRCVSSGHSSVALRSWLEQHTPMKTSQRLQCYNGHTFKTVTHICVTVPPMKQSH